MECARIKSRDTADSIYIYIFIKIREVPFNLTKVGGERATRSEVTLLVGWLVSGSKERLPDALRCSSCYLQWTKLNDLQLFCLFIKAILHPPCLLYHPYYLSRSLLSLS